MEGFLPNILHIYDKNLFLTRKQTDYVWHLIFARVEKAEVIPDNRAPKSCILPFVKTTIRPLGGASGVMVIIVGNGHGDTSSNPGRD